MTDTTWIESLGKFVPTPDTLECSLWLFSKDEVVIRYVLRCMDTGETRIRPGRVFNSAHHFRVQLFVPKDWCEPEPQPITLAPQLRPDNVNILASSESRRAIAYLSIAFDTVWAGPITYCDQTDSWGQQLIV